MLENFNKKNMLSFCVFCGARMGHKSVWQNQAQELGQALAVEKVRLVYGGGHTGLMGQLADACLNFGGQVVGVIPQHLQEKELAHQALTELYVVNSMHERKALMADKSDGFIAMAGGFGTLDELCEIITWKQLKIHHKPIGLFNRGGFFTPFIEFIKSSVHEGFISTQDLDDLIIEEDPMLLIQKMKIAIQDNK